MKVGDSSIGCVAASARSVRSIFSSPSVVSAYPLFASHVVVPQRSISSRRTRVSAASDASVAARVAITVLRIPPPSAAISA